MNTHQDDQCAQCGEPVQAGEVEFTVKRRLGGGEDYGFRGFLCEAHAAEMEAYMGALADVVDEQLR